MQFRCDTLAGLQQLEIRLNSAALQRHQIWFLIVRAPPGSPHGEPVFLLATGAPAESPAGPSIDSDAPAVWAVDTARGTVALADRLTALAADGWQPAFLDIARRGDRPGEPDTFVIVARRLSDSSAAIGGRH